MAKIIKNWAGIEAHRTDEYVHWSSKDVYGKMEKIRKVYDAIVAAGLKDEVEVIIDMVDECVRLDEEYYHNSKDF